MPPIAAFYSEEELLPVSALQHLVFCPRRAALVYLENVWSDNEYTVDGLQRHETVHEESVRHAKGTRIVRALPLRSLSLGLVGIADVIEISGEGPLTKVFPVEHKRGRLRHERGYEVQLCAQALCLEEALGVPVEAGALFFWENRRRLTIELDDQLRCETRGAALELHRLFSQETTPPAVPGRRCGKCSLAELCRPRLARKHRKAEEYLRFLADGDPTI